MIWIITIAEEMHPLLWKVNSPSCRTCRFWAAVFSQFLLQLFGSLGRQSRKRKHLRLDSLRMGNPLHRLRKGLHTTSTSAPPKQATLCTLVCDPCDLGVSHRSSQLCKFAAKFAFLLVHGCQQMNGSYHTHLKRPDKMVCLTSWIHQYLQKT